jgi:hypothetical protein
VIPHAVACGITSLKSNKDISNIYRISTTMFTHAETDRNFKSNYILFNFQGGMTVHLLELQPLMVLLPIPKITAEAIWIMRRIVINRRKLM